MLIKFEVNIELAIIRFFRLSEGLEKVADAVRGECRLAQDAHDFEDGPADFEVVLDDGNETICDDGNVYLYPNGIFGFSPETFDLKMLLNPLEEQLHLPAIFVKQGNVLCTEEEVVRIVRKGTVQVRCVVDNPSDNAWVLLLILLLREADTLVFEHIVFAFKQGLAIDNLVCGLSLLPDNKEGTTDMNLIESGEVKVAPVKYIAGQSLVCEPIHGVDIMDLCVGNPIKYGNLCGDVNLGVDPDARLCASELCPPEHGHTEVDSGGVDGIEPAMKLELLRDTFGLGNGNHVKGKLLKDAMVSKRIGLRQHLSVDGLMAKAEVFGLSSMSNRNVCEFPEASAAHELTEHQNQQVVPMRHRPALGPVVVLGEYTPELPLREELYYLCKNVCTCMHICSDFESDAKVSISKLGQCIGELKRCA